MTSPEFETHYPSGQPEKSGSIISRAKAVAKRAVTAVFDCPPVASEERETNNPWAAVQENSWHAIYKTRLALRQQPLLRSPGTNRSFPVSIKLFDKETVESLFGLSRPPQPEDLLRISCKEYETVMPANYIESVNLELLDGLSGEPIDTIVCSETALQDLDTNQQANVAQLTEGIKNHINNIHQNNGRNFE